METRSVRKQLNFIRSLNTAMTDKSQAYKVKGLTKSLKAMLESDLNSNHITLTEAPVVFVRKVKKVGWVVL